MEFIKINGNFNSLSNLNVKSKMLATPWNRIVRGLGIGQHSISYRSDVYDKVNKSFIEMKKINNEDYYVRSSSMLVDLLSVIKERSKELDLNILIEYLSNLISSTSYMSDSYQRLMFRCMMISSLYNHGIDAFELLKDSFDLFNLLVSDLDNIESDGILDENKGKHGDYEKLSAFTSLFFMISECNNKNLLNDINRDLVGEAVRTLSRVPSPYFRGRGGSMLILSIFSLGLQSRLFSSDGDSVILLYDFLDDNVDSRMLPSFPGDLSNDFVKFYPLITMLNSISFLDKEKYLLYKKDRLLECQILFEKLRPVEKTHMALYYIVALYNLGEIDNFKVESIVDEQINTVLSIDPATDYFLYGISVSYVIILCNITGFREKITEDLIVNYVNCFVRMNRSVEDECNRAYPYSYAFMSITDLGLVDIFFEGNDNYEGLSPMEWIINNNVKPGCVNNRLYMLCNSFINLISRMTL